MSTDSEIFAAARESPAAFAQLYDRHAPAVFRYVARRLDRHAAEDIASETFLVAFEKRDSFDLTFDRALPWLLGIATNLIHKRTRLEARAWRGMLASYEAGAVSVDQFEQLGARIDAERLAGVAIHAVRRMNVGDRDVLLLYAWGDLTYEEISIALRIPVGTVRSRLHRARKSLRAALNRESTPSKEEENGRAHTHPQPAI